MEEPRPAGAADGAVFYRFTDRDGRLHIVDSWSSVPAPLRGKAERIELEPRSNSLIGDLPKRFDPLSFALGVGAALLVGVGVRLLRGRLGPIAKIGAGLALVALLLGAYFGFLRRTTGQTDALVSSPAALIEDARRSVKSAEDRRRRDEEVLRELERQAR